MHRAVKQPQIQLFQLLSCCCSREVRTRTHTHTATDLEWLMSAESLQAPCIQLCPPSALGILLLLLAAFSHVFGLFCSPSCLPCGSPACRQHEEASACTVQHHFHSTPVLREASGLARTHSKSIRAAAPEPGPVPSASGQGTVLSLRQKPQCRGMGTPTGGHGGGSDGAVAVPGALCPSETTKPQPHSPIALAPAHRPFCDGSPSKTLSPQFRADAFIM